MAYASRIRASELGVVEELAQLLAGEVAHVARLHRAEPDRTDPGAGQAGDRVADVSYDAVGCSISQASASVLNDLVVGKSVEDGLAVLDQFHELMQGKGQVVPDEDVLEDGVAFAGVAQFPARVKCALLSWMAFKDAVLQVSTGSTTAEEA